MLISILHPITLTGAADTVFYFTVYSFFGWLLENSYSFFMKSGFFKPNFLRGPFKPMYGIAPVLLLFFLDKNSSWPVVLFLCFIIPSLVEYISGIILQKVFHRQYWDYSNIPLQLHGMICLPFSLCWILLSISCLKWIHPLISSLYQALFPFWLSIYPAVILYFFIVLLMAVWKHSAQVIDESNTIS